MSNSSERHQHEGLHFSYMRFHQHSRELAHQLIQRMNDELSKKDDEIERLRKENERLRRLLWEGE